MVFKRFQGSPCEELEWHTNEMEIQMMYAMLHHKPVGINKHFHMACIIHTLQKNLNRKVSSQSVWKYLETLYNLPLLGETEDAQFPVAEKDFILPESCFMFMKKDKSDENVKAKVEEISEVKNKLTKPKDAKLKQEDAKEAHRSDGGSKSARKSLIKGTTKKEHTKDERKDIKKDGKEKKSNSVHDKSPRQESKENKEDKKDIKKETSTKKDPEEKETKVKVKDSSKDKHMKKDDTSQTSKKDRPRDDDSPKRNVKRTRGSMKVDDASSSHSSSPVTTQTVSAQKRRRV